MGSRWDRIGLVSIALATFGVVVLGIVYQYRSNLVEEKQRAFAESRRSIIVSVCEKLGMEAIDIEYPHTPKCWDPKTELMRVPRVLYNARGGHL